MENWRRLLMLLVLAAVLAVAWARAWWTAWGTPDPAGENDTPVRAEPRKEPPKPSAARVAADGANLRGDPSDPALAAACRKTAAWLSQQLGNECHVIVRVPLVIGGDLPEEELDRWHRQTIGPAARIMAADYFAVPPHEPVTILLLGNQRSYRRYAEQLFGDEDISIYGYYRPHLRTLVMNIGTGGGTLLHELTHALIAFDLAEVPDWLSEGLASLHEACRIHSSPPRIEGLVNWRLPALQEAIRAGRLRSLESLVRSDDFHGPQQALNYAQARYFCLYMQDQGVLQKFYREFRTNHKQDPCGYQTVARIFPQRSWEEIDADFRRFVLALKRPNGES